MPRSYRPMELSALAVARHGSRMLESILKRLAGSQWTIAPITIVEQGRVANRR